MGEEIGTKLNPILRDTFDNEALTGGDAAGSLPAAAAAPE